MGIEVNKLSIFPKPSNTSGSSTGPILPPSIFNILPKFNSQPVSKIEHSSQTVKDPISSATKWGKQSDSGPLLVGSVSKKKKTKVILSLSSTSNDQLSTNSTSIKDEPQQTKSVAPWVRSKKE